MSSIEQIGITACDDYIANLEKLERKIRVEMTTGYILMRDGLPLHLDGSPRWCGQVVPVSIELASRFTATTAHQRLEQVAALYPQAQVLAVPVLLAISGAIAKQQEIRDGLLSAANWKDMAKQTEESAA